MKRRHSRGVALIELAAVLAACVILLGACLSYGRLALQGAVLDQATADAARYLATLPPEELRDSGRRAIALANAQAMVEQALAAAGVQVLELQLDYRCGPNTCNLVTATNPLSSMTVIALLQYHDTWLGAGAGDLEVRAHAEAGRGN